MARWFGRRRRDEQRAISYQDVWGSGGNTLGTRSDTMHSALALVPVFAATRLLTETIASLPLQQFRRVGESRRQMNLANLLQDPTAYGTQYEWIQRAMASLVLRGNAYGYVTEYDDNVLPRRVEWLNPDEVGVKDNRTVAVPQWFWMGREVDGSRFLHVPGQVLPGYVLGLSPISYYAATIDTGILAKEFGRDWFQNGSIPAAVLTGSGRIDEAGAEKVKKIFRRAARNRDVAVMGGDYKYEPITVPPNESQFLATMQATVNEVASIYGIPAERIGGTSSSSRTYANREQDAIDFVTYSLGPYLVKLETALSQLLPDGQYVKFNVDALTRADIKTRYESHDLALRGGWLNRDEVRRLEDLPPLPDGQGQTYSIAEPQLPAVQAEQGRMQLRAAVPETHVSEAAAELTAFFQDQADEVTDLALNERKISAFDLDKWNTRLIPLLLGIAQRISGYAGRTTMRKLGLSPEAYDAERTISWLTKHAAGVATAINRTTEARIVDALASDDPSATIGSVFSEAVQTRAPAIAQTEVTASAGFGTREAAQQSGQPLKKVWRTGKNPRPTHEAMNGQSAGIEDLFPNGARWPGDTRLPESERANCNCSMSIVTE